MSTRQIILACIAILASSLGFSLWARYGLIESVSVATQCNATFVPFSCTVRNFVIASTVLPFWGYMALAAGVFALLLRRFDLTLLALVAGSVGVVLYAGATAAVGLLLGWITLARLLAQAPVAKQ